MTTIILIGFLVTVVCWCLYILLGFALARSSLVPPKWRIWLTPTRNFKTNWAWDRKLNQLLDETAPIEIIDQYHATIGDQEIWLENFPYASFTGYGVWAKTLPSRKTAVRLTERLMQHGWVPK